MKSFASVAIAVLSCLTASVAVASVEIVAPAELLADADFTFRLTGIDPGGTVDVQSDFVTPGGTIWRSIATFVADEHGLVDPARSAPVSGSWRVADAHAFLWAMEKTKESSNSPTEMESDERSIVTIRVLAQGKRLAEKRVTLWKRAPGISTTEIRGPIVGAFFQPYGNRSLPTVIVLGGSEGGLNRAAAALLASHGFATLAVAYFGIDPLPGMLDRIPVETIDRAIEWLRSQPAVDPTRIAVMGGSKGAELALLAASLNPSIHAVIAAAPSSVVFQSITYGKGGVTSSWTKDGKDLPFAPYVEAPAYAQSHRLVDLYEPSLAAAPAASAIAIEKIRGPVLLIAGKDDALWPSATMAAQLVARAGEKNPRSSVVNLTFEHAGHHVAGIPNRPTADSVRLGGTAEGLAEAQRKSWTAIVDFLGRSLRAGKSPGR